ncbi:MAG: hypothetical protein JXR73_03315 [Candidatus Omnitrophica bacterium]|nr:hypothetical protein [Candidatus Omnitrophota bacterium]
MKVGWLLPLAAGFCLDWQLQSSIFGLPIDDAYIYVKYIDNLAQGAGFSFNPHETSFGVTSFLFTILGATAKTCLPWIDSATICQWIGVATHLSMLWLAQRIVHRLTENYLLSWLAGALLALCRPLYFTAPSGLETPLFLLTAMIVIWIGLRRPGPNLVNLGAAGALLYLSRPEGFFFTLSFLAALAVYPLIFEPEKVWLAWKKISGRVLYYIAGFSMVAAPYLFFVKAHSGHWMPMTFYGKLINRSTFLFEPWHEKLKSGVFAVVEGYQQMIAQDPTPFLFGLWAFLSFLSFLFFALDCGRRKPDPFPFAVRTAVFSFLAFPFLFGAVFRTSPMFGGYFVRYIQILIVVIHIEGVVGFHRMASMAANVFRTEANRRRFVRVASAFLIPAMIYSAKVALERMAGDREFYKGHVTVNESVRKKAAQWIDQNTEPDARIFTSNTGLGAVGAYCHRFVRDEAGLISSDIYPFLLGYSQGFNHWHKMMEYMKEMDIDYYTTFPPYGSENRHSKTIAEIEEPSLKGTRLERTMRIRISRFIAPEAYDLWADYESEATFVDRAEKPAVDGRVRLTRWGDKPVIAMQTRSDPADIRQRMIFPSNACMAAGVGFDFDREFGPDDQVVIEIKVNYGSELETVFTKTYSLQECARQSRIDSLQIDLSAYSKKYAFLLYGARSSGPNASGIWTGWIEPNLLSMSDSL